MDRLTSANVAVLPVGEIESEPVKTEFAAFIQALQTLATDLRIVGAVSTEEAAQRSVQELSALAPDLLVIIVSRGLSARVIEAAIGASQTPCLVLPLRGNYAFPSSALAVGACQELQVPVELLYGTPAHSEFIQRLGRLVRAASAFSKIRKTRIGVIGGLFPNLVSCRYDPALLGRRLGITLLPVSFESLHNAVQTIADQPQASLSMQNELTKTCRFDPADQAVLDAGIGLHLALKDLAAEQGLDGFAVECWSGFPRELGLNPCLGFIEDAYELACEGDVLLCIALLMVRYLTGKRAFVGDLFDLDPEGVLTLIHCGAPASLCVQAGDVVLTRSPLAHERGFETLTCRPALEPGPVTLIHFYGEGCEKVHLAFGDLLHCDRSANLTVQVKLDGDRWDFLDQCLGNHYLAAAGDLRNELKLLCKWLKIEVFET